MRYQTAPLPVACVHSTFQSVRPRKPCGRCGQRKPAAEFAWRRKARGQRDNYCRARRADYKRQHYSAHRERYVANAAQRKRTTARERASPRRDQQVRRRLCKLSSSPYRPSGRVCARGGSSTVEPRPSKAMMRVRFPSAALRLTVSRQPPRQAGAPPPARSLPHPPTRGAAKARTSCRAPRRA